MLKSITTFYTLLHFLVDFACAGLLYHLVRPIITNQIELFYAFLLYNFFAFAIQLPIGILADFINKNALFASIGCLLVALAFSLTPFPILAAIIAGIGNACFHIGGGVDILNISKGKATFPGIFVSSGALGIFFGAQNFLNTHLLSLILPFLLCMGSLLALYIHKKYWQKMQNISYQLISSSKLKFFMIFCLCSTVFLRSYTGFLFAFEWKKIFLFAFCFTFCIFFGKLFGGLLSDRFGMKKIAILSLTLSAFCFCFSFQNNITGIITAIFGVLFFNMSMPITLTALTNLIPTQKGLAFGLLTCMLFLGALPMFFGIQLPFFSPLGLCLLIFLSLAMLLGGLIKQ